MSCRSFSSLKRPYAMERPGYLLYRPHIATLPSDGNLWISLAGTVRHTVAQTKIWTRRSRVASRRPSASPNGSRAAGRRSAGMKRHQDRAKQGRIRLTSRGGNDRVERGKGQAVKGGRGNLEAGKCWLWRWATNGEENAVSRGGSYPCRRLYGSGCSFG